MVVDFADDELWDVGAAVEGACERGAPAGAVFGAGGEGGAGGKGEGGGVGESGGRGGSAGSAGIAAIGGVVNGATGGWVEGDGEGVEEEVG